MGDAYSENNRMCEENDRLYEIPVRDDPQPEPPKNIETNVYYVGLAYETFK